MKMDFQDIIQFVKSLYPGQDFIPLHAPVFRGKEKEYVLETIESTYVSSVGAYVDRFERMMAEYTGAKHAVAVVNGTAALHISLLLAGVQRGDLVLTQALSFVATCNAISYLGAEPYFLDVEPQTLGLSPDALAAFLETVEWRNGQPYHRPSGRRVAACVPMHTFGHPVRLNEIADLCLRSNIPLIEDAAESIGSYYHDKHTGTLGLFGTFSFNGNKTITCGGGGIIVTNDTSQAKLAKHLTTQAKVPHRWEFNHDHVGYNYRCPNLNAALACAQLEQLDGFLENKRQTAQAYSQFFNQYGSNIRFVTEPEHTKANYWLNAVLMPDLETRNAFLTATNDAGVMTRPIWTLMHRLPMFEKCGHDGLINSIVIEQTLVNIPSSVR